MHTACKFEPEIAGKAAKLFEDTANTSCFGEVDKRKLRDIGIQGEFAKRFSEPKVFEEAKNIIRYCEDNGIRIITRESEEYPEYLLHTIAAPRLLFAKGEKLDLNRKVTVSVVGCRRPTDQGLIIARNIGKELGKAGIVTVSGMAEGIDAEAHWGALEGGGKTIAVLAGSVDNVYPKSNEKLYREIIKNGTVISERPPKTITKRYFYQQRNRIIVGLSRGTVFVEGDENSGTSMSARLALENNRDIFAVPGNIMNWQSNLTNRLISEGAIVVNKTEVPAEYYRQQNPEMVKVVARKAEQTRKYDGLMSEDEKVISFLRDKGSSATIEELSEVLDIEISVLSGRLTIMAIKGIIRQGSGNRYILCE